MIQRNNKIIEKVLKPKTNLFEKFSFLVVNFYLYKVFLTKNNQI